MTAAQSILRVAGLRIVPLALRNLLANKRRLVRSSAGIGFAVLLMLVQLGFEQGFFDASLAMPRLLDADLIVMSASKYQFASADPFGPQDLDSARKVAGIASVSPLYASWQDFFWKNPADDRVYLVRAFAFDPDHPELLIPGLAAESARLSATDTVLIDRAARGFLGMADAAGDTDINGRPVHIVGSFALGPDFISDGTVLMSPASFARLLSRGQASAARLPVEFGIVKLAPGEEASRVQAALQAALPTDLRVLTKPQLIAFERNFQAELSSAGPIFWLGTIVGFVVGMLISYQIIYTELSDQLPQYATLKGIGYETHYLVRVVIEQAALSALAGYVPAWLFCLVVYRAVSAVSLLPLHMTLRLTLITLGLTLGMCVLSAILAIRRVVAADPAEVF